jgi:hypothetical protein
MNSRTYLMIIAAGIAVFCSYLIIPTANRIAVYEDDALFYSIVASYAVTGNGFTFDGGNSQTNGFHWGRMVLSLLTFEGIELVKGQTSFREAMSVAFYVDAMTLAVCSMIIAMVMSRFVTRGWLAAVLVPLVAQALSTSFGMEQLLTATLLVMSIGHCASLHPKSLRVFFISFVMATTRIDSVWMAPLVVVATLSVNGRTISSPERLKLLSGSILGAVAGVVVTGLLNYLAAGDCLSSSMIAKGYRLGFSAETLFLELSEKKIPLAILFLLGAFAWTALRRRGTMSPEAPVACVVSLLGISSLLIVSIQRSSGSNIGVWYDAIWATAIVVSGGLMATFLLNRGFFGEVLILAVVGLLVLAVPEFRRHIDLRANGVDERGEYFQSFDRIGQRIREQTQEADLIGTCDLPGRLTYFSGRRIVALDGLANSPRYVKQVLIRGQIVEYVHRNISQLLIFDRRKSDQFRREKIAYIGFPFSRSIPQEEYHFTETDIVFEDVLGDVYVYFLQVSS